MSPRPLVVIGDANPDLVLTGDVTARFGQAEQLLDSATLTMGGSASIMACGAARLGIATELVAHVSADQFGRYVLDELAARGVRTDRVRVHETGSTGLSVILSTPTDRAILTHVGALAAVSCTDIDPDSLPPGTHVHAAGFFLLPALASGLPSLFASLRARGCTTSLDTNWDPIGRWAGVHEVLAHTDVFFPNVNEAVAIAGCRDPDDSGRHLAGHGCIVAMKRGAAGGSLWAPGATRVDAAPPNVELVDTTGAGDSFDAGFLAAWLRGCPPDASLRAAVTAGSLSTRAAGGIGSQATWAEIEPA